ncbi:Short-chain dehydrogenase/reductase SDR [Dillenia turbinata]|uniref:Short-chain dehydrogenase/reductase SDR n=1 Tax=Dillenia turbinata TaxID=194707 RepID=A0AAN8UZS2_9MAGN
MDATKRYAVVTGANKGIGLEICKQLATNGVAVILTARDEKRGLEALEKLKEFGLSDYLIFHQLDVTDPSAVTSLADFVKSKFGRLDILPEARKVDWSGIVKENYELAEEGINTNYYGAKRMVEAFLPLLQLSNAPKIVNVSSSMGKLNKLNNEWAKGILSDAEGLTEEKIDEVLAKYLKDFEEGSPETKGWPKFMSAYVVSKAAMSAYTRVLAKKYPNFYINCICPGYVKTDINGNTGVLTVEDGAASVVKLALQPDGDPTGCFFVRNEVSSYDEYAVVTGANKGIGLEVCRQLAANGVMVLLSARNEKRGLEAFEKLKESEVSDNVIFHQLDVTDSSSVAFLADFVKNEFGRLDILVNNAGIAGAAADFDGMRARQHAAGGLSDKFDWSGLLEETYELAEECINTNFYGAKRMVEAFVPLLGLSKSANIVNVSSSAGKLKRIPNEWAKGVLSDVEGLTEERVDQIVIKYLQDLKEGTPETKGWPKFLSAYCVSKAAMNAYTRILAKKYSTFSVNCICPGYVKTDITGNNGILTIEEGAQSIVNLALQLDGSPSGCFFSRNKVSSYNE